MQTSEDNTTGFYINFVTIFLLVNGNYFLFCQPKGSVRAKGTPLKKTNFCHC